MGKENVNLSDCSYENDCDDYSELDYTKWQTDLYSDMSVSELFDAASSWKENMDSGT